MLSSELCDITVRSYEPVRNQLDELGSVSYMIMMLGDANFRKSKIS